MARSPSQTPPFYDVISNLDTKRVSVFHPVPGLNLLVLAASLHVWQHVPPFIRPPDALRVCKLATSAGSDRFGHDRATSRVAVGVGAAEPTGTSRQGGVTGLIHPQASTRYVCL